MSNENISRVGQDFNLPDEILSVIPTDPYDQLDLARKITSMAIASRVSSLETETALLRQKLTERDLFVDELQTKVSRLETANEDAEFRLKLTREDNMKLVSEKESLAMQVKKLNRDLAKLETFKRQLMRSLNDDDSPQSAETVDIRTYDQSLLPKAYSTNSSYEGPNGYQKYHSYVSSNSSSINDASKQSEIISLSPRLTPRVTPTGTPRVVSTSISPRRYSTTVSPQRTSGATSPVARYEGRGSLSSWYSSSQQSSAANSPPPGQALSGRAPRIDGKEFFRQARSRLSLEQFSAFLTNIKELNKQNQSREMTLIKAEEIFGLENKDLYTSFQRLLNREAQ